MAASPTIGRGLVTSACSAVVVLATAGCAGPEATRRSSDEAARCQDCLEFVLISTDRAHLVASVELSAGADRQGAIEHMKAIVATNDETRTDMIGLRRRDSAALCLATLAGRDFGLPLLSQDRDAVFETRDELIQELLASLED